VEVAAQVKKMKILALLLLVELAAVVQVLLVEQAK
jgi:hypothetical protein